MPLLGDSQKMLLKIRWHMKMTEHNHFICHLYYVFLYFLRQFYLIGYDSPE